MSNLSSLKEKLITKKTLFLSAGVTAILVAGIFIYPSLTTGAADADAIVANQYKEEVAEIGNIVVGVTEEGSASMNDSSVNLEFETVIEEALVKAGQYVEEGTPVAKISLEEFELTYNELMLELQNAQIDLQNAYLDADSQSIDAQMSYNEAVYNGENAEALYELSIEELQAGYDKIQNEIDSLRDEWSELDDQKDEGPDEDDIDDIEDEIDELKAEIADLEAQLEHAENCPTNNSKTSAVNDAFLVSEISEDVSETTADENADNSAEPTEDTNTEDTSNEEPESNDSSDECDHPEYEHDIDELENDLEKLYEELDKKEDELDNAEDAAGQDYDDIDSKMDDIEDDLDAKYLELETYQSTMDLQMLEIEADYDSNVYNHSVAESSYQNDLSKSNSSILSAQQKVAELQNDIAALDEVSEDGIILAPISGYVMTIAEEGDDLNANSAIITIAEKEVVNIIVSIAQEDIADIEIGMDANILFDAYDDITIPAVVDSISISPSGSMQSSVNYSVSIACDLTNFPETVVYNGMTAEVTFIQKQIKDVIAISNKCIINEDGAQYVKVKAEDGSISQVPVKTGFSDGFTVEITEGINEGDIVLIESAVNMNAN